MANIIENEHENSVSKIQDACTVYARFFSTAAIKIFENFSIKSLFLMCYLFTFLHLNPVSIYTENTDFVSQETVPHFDIKN